MEYKNIDRSQQAQVLRGRLQQWEAEHLNHATNISVIKATGSNTDQDKALIAQSEEAMKILDAAHAEVTVQLAELERDQSASVTAPEPKKAGRPR